MRKREPSAKFPPRKLKRGSRGEGEKKYFREYLFLKAPAKLQRGVAAGVVRIFGQLRNSVQLLIERRRKRVISYGEHFREKWIDRSIGERKRGGGRGWRWRNTGLPRE